MGKRLDSIPDFIWPHLTGEPKPQPEDRQPVVISDVSLLEAAEEAFSKRVEEADERLRSVDARLMPLLALASIIAAVLSASVPFALSGQFDQISTAELAVVLTILAYIGLQIVICLRAAVRGLSRRAYLALDPNDLDPQPGEASTDYRLRILEVRVNNLWHNEWATDQKVSEMAIAHEALQNMIRGVAVLVIAALVIAFIGSLESNPSPPVGEFTPVATASPAP